MSIQTRRRQILGIMLFYAAAAGAAAFLSDSPRRIFSGLMHILTSPAQLTVDFFHVGSAGGAFLNVALVGLSCWAVYALSGAPLSGTSLMAYFLTIGFSFFGMSLLNIWPCILGTWLFSRVSGKAFADQANVALFSTALSPFVSEALWRYPALDGLPAAMLLRSLLGLLLGCAAGFLMPILCRHSPSLHHGYTLYNAAAVAGYIGIALFSLMYRAAGIEIPTNTIIGDSHPVIVNVFVLATSVAAIIAGFFMNGRSLTGLSIIYRSTGYSCDFTQTAGIPATLIHIGAFGLFAAGYYNLTDASMTGPTAGSIICLLAIAPCGAHALNVLPIMLGYVLASACGSFALNTQSIVVGLCFAGALCPISGRFGALSGILAGFLHVCMVTTVVTFHGGMCLYNGGFTCGITAILLVPLLEYFFVPADQLRLLPSRRGKNAKDNSHPERGQTVS